MRRAFPAFAVMLLVAGCAATGPGAGPGEAPAKDQYGELARFEVTGNIRTRPGENSASDGFRLQFIDTGFDYLSRGEDRVMRSYALKWGAPFTLTFDYFWTARQPQPKHPEITVEISAQGCRGVSQPVQLDRLERNENGAYLINLDLEIGPCDAPG